MTSDHTPHDTQADGVRRDPLRVTDRDVYLLVVLEVAVMLLWALWQLLDVELEVRGAQGTQQVTLTAVVLTTTLAAVASYVLLWLLRRHGLRTWTGVAAFVLVVSCAGPLTATTSWAGVARLSFHLLVGIGLIAGVRRLHAPGPGSRGRR
jgi:hypothetical protein